MEPARTLEPGWRHALRLWWSFSWRWPLYALIPLVPIALTVAVIKPPPEVANRLAFWVTWPITIWAQVAALKRLLKLDYGGFSVRAVERDVPR
ncbi:MAG: hypothetical protein PHF00_00035 [Elusimicrobia bacterium]|nr:hypothetical protein [Elusimicrobiota bacterium]